MQEFVRGSVWRCVTVLIDFPEQDFAGPLSLAVT